MIWYDLYNNAGHKVNSSGYYVQFFFVDEKSRLSQKLLIAIWFKSVELLTRQCIASSHIATT